MIGIEAFFRERVDTHWQEFNLRSILDLPGRLTPMATGPHISAPAFPLPYLTIKPLIIAGA